MLPLKLLYLIIPLKAVKCHEIAKIAETPKFHTTTQCQGHHKVSTILKNPQKSLRNNFNLCGMHHTDKSISTVCITPLSQSTRCASHGGVNLRGVHLTMQSKSKSSLVPDCF